jgi:hypothetical protein
MKPFYISILIGLVAGIIDILPMVAQKLPKRAIISAFLHYLFVSIVIVNCTIPGLVWWLKGGLISLALSLPILVIISENDKKAIPIIISMSIVLGTLIGITGHILTNQ